MELLAILVRSNLIRIENPGYTLGATMVTGIGTPAFANIMYCLALLSQISITLGSLNTGIPSFFKYWASKISV